MTLPITPWAEYCRENGIGSWRKTCPSCGSTKLTVDRSNHIVTIACTECGCKEMSRFE